MKKLLPALLLSFMMLACSSESHEHQTQPSPLATERAEAYNLATTDAFNTSFQLALDAYFDLKDALVETDASKAADLAEILHGRLQVVSIENLDTPASVLWADEGAIATRYAENIKNESDVEQQRLYFESVSDAFIHMAKAYGPFENTIFVQTCPMVRGGSADWLSREEQIMNPYHGSRMLNCGSVIERI
ncbi:MAG: DUF3347 domain-containing protein [Bacteroidetes bacterium]|nr:DUF3347 domain-containing protein [Bacteroidota bacterium]MCH8524474.1 DUF3347 domain-containing protein [Balneolales bacterium]